MGRRAKTPRFEEFNSYVNCFDIKRKPRDWFDIFGNDNPLTLELGAGKAEVSMGLAKKYKDRNFIAIDRKSDRLWRPAKSALELKLDNIAFLRLDILSLEELIPKKSVDEIWITFPDPFPRDKQAKHRMLNENFLQIYKKILKPDAFVHYKTDNSELFEWTVELLKNLKYIKIDLVERDLHNSNLDEEIKIITTYEKKFKNMGYKINYMKFHFV